ncbi:hypothetical protein FOL47_008410 [Perkinsus chesapeaki]|uniref:Uncharacterized protein n=1 Tax=Perkinsus chesapeaki TaxID=330153 RepID=A0A7J6LEU3_PERCH|nr:hypothetical protein FOL47_008410 [Perkinsus chesapeaki]
MIPMPESEQFSVALWRFVFTTGGVLLVILTSCLVFPNFAAIQLIKASERSIQSVAEGIAPFLIGGSLKQCEGDDERMAALLQKWQDFGRDTYTEVASRISFMDDASAEIAVYGKVHLVPELSKWIWLKQKYITNTQRSGLDSEIQELVSPATPRMRSYGKVVQASATRMTELLRTGVVSSSLGVSNADDDLHVEVQRCIETMQEMQNRITDEFLASPNTSGDTSAIMELFPAAYALSDFALVWEQLENALMGERPPCELVERSQHTASSSASGAVPTLRGIAQPSS